MVPRRTARNTRHAIALASAKYAVASIGCSGPGMLGERMRAVETTENPIVDLVHKLDCRISNKIKVNPTDK